ncbi:MAG: DUF1003 domain-containing protein [Streptosporangiales bacterium]|nr:DUF1003 domain-containing protein [Streptosporangiales bacterium]
MARDRLAQRTSRIDQPRRYRRSVPRLAVDPEHLGNLADGVARFLGSWRFIGYMTVVIAIWLGWNLVMPGALRFDTYPFIFLTLALSLQASYAAPLILLAQNRQADRDRVQYEQDRTTTERNLADTEYLTREIAALRIAVGEVATRDFVRAELKSLLEELDRERHRETETAGSSYPSHDK